MAYLKNLDIKKTGLRHGYITKNDRVHKVSRVTLDDSGNATPTTVDPSTSPAMYGADGEGDLGYGKHAVLANIFNHPNAVINRQSDPNADVEGVSDKSIARRILFDRDNLNGSKTFVQELEDRQAVLETTLSNHISARQADDPNYDDAAQADDTVVIDLNSKIEAIENFIDDPTNAGIVDAIAAENEIGTAFNPDFPLNDVNFSYVTTVDNNRGNDLSGQARHHRGVALSPNVSFPSNSESISNPEVIVTYQAGHEGGGGFGVTHSEAISAGAVNNSDIIIDDIVNVYND